MLSMIFDSQTMCVRNRRPGRLLSIRAIIKKSIQETQIYAKREREINWELNNKD